MMGSWLLFSYSCGKKGESCMKMSFMHTEMKSEKCLLLNSINKFTNMGGCILKMKKNIKIIPLSCRLFNHRR